MCVVVLGSAEVVRNMQPDISALATLGGHGVIITAPGGGVDDDVGFVSRFFAPQIGIDEDPVTGAAHTVTALYWARRLKKDVLSARQVSSRGGDMGCELVGDRVRLSGRAVLFMKGEAYSG